MTEKQILTQTVAETPGTRMRGTDNFTSFLDKPLLSAMRVNWETVAWVTLIAVAFVLRIYDVGARAMSHDESLHALYSYYLYNEGRYEHNPMMHGPLLFHLNALVYFLFGDNDTTARLAPVLAGTGIIYMTWLFRRYIGRTGALIAGILLTVSPSLLFHSRYIRDDIYIAFFLMIWVYAAFRYLDTRQSKWLTAIALGMVFGILAMEAHFISGAILGVFFVGLALWQVIGMRVFYAALPPFLGFLVWFYCHEIDVDLAKQAEALLQTAADQSAELTAQATRYGRIGLIALAIGGLIMLVLLWRDVKRPQWLQLRRSPSMDLAILMLTLVLPFAAPFGHLVFGWDAMAYATTTDLLRSASLVLAMTLASVAIAWYWFAQRTPAPTPDEIEENPAATPNAGFISFGIWAQLMAVFWTIAILFFTTFLTNTKNGLATGIVGSLGYWLAQQEVKRGGQPLYYYLMLGWIYEFLPIILSLAGMAVVVRWLLKKPDWDPVPAAELVEDATSTPVLAQTGEATGVRRQPKTAAENAVAGVDLLRQNRAYFAAFSIWWILATWLAFTVAGEKMPWLLTHMALPMCIFGGWYLGRLLHRIDWANARRHNALWLIGITPAVILVGAVLLGAGPETEYTTGAVANTLRWILGLGLLGGLFYLVWRWSRTIGWPTAGRLLSLGAVTVLFLLTLRVSFTLTYINYDMATEYLVYAHATPDIKIALNEIDLISERTAGGRNIVVAYSNDMSWPMSWYMRLYPNAKFFGKTPNSDSMSAPVILVGSDDYEQVHPYVQRDYIKRSYRQVWWPDMDYFNMTWARLGNAITDPQQRDRIWNILFHRRYKNKDDLSQWVNMANWPHQHGFELWVRRDLAAQIWDLGVTPVTDAGNSVEALARAREIDLTAFGLYNATYAEQALITPRTLAIAPDGARVIADTGNNRVVVLDRDGNFLRSFGSQCKLSEQDTPGCQDLDGDGPLALGDGQFNEPWGIAVDPQGQIYVADTWNGRIQVFDAAGQFVRKWGFFSTTNGELGDANALFGPRGIAINLSGNLLVADTGNKRILEYTPTGELVRQIGGGGVVGGRFEEPTGVAVSPIDGSVFVADAWNRRIQKLSPTLDFVAEWPVPSWDNHDIYMKPYIAVASNGDVYVTDPQFFRVFVYSGDGELRSAFGNFGTEANRFGLPNGIAIDLAANAVLIADASNNRVMAFPAAP